MNPLKTSDIARRLAAREDIEPPVGLLEKIKSEIPAELPVAPKIAEQIGRAERAPRRRVWLMAASVAAALGGGLLALHVRQSAPPPELVMQERAREDRAEAPKPAPKPEPGSRGPSEAPERKAAPLVQAPAQGQAQDQVREMPRELYREQDEETAEEPRAFQDADAKEKKDAAGLRASGDLAQRQEQPVEVPQSMPELEPPPPPAPAAPPPPPPPPPPKIESGVAGGVAGGVPGGAVGGVPGGGAGRNEAQPEARGRTSFDLRRDAPAAKTAAPSTGGTAEPNDQLQPHGGVDADTGSYTVARRYLREGHLPPPEAVRTEEFVSFFSYCDAPPNRGDFALVAEGAPAPFAAGPQVRLLRFNICAREVTAENRKPAVIAKDAKVQVDFNPAVVSRWRLLGDENRGIAGNKLRDDTVDAGEIGAGHSVTALYEVELKPGATGKIATLHLRFRTADTGVIRETAHDLRVSELALSWEAASPGFHLAALVAELAEVLRGSYWARDVNLDDLVSRARHTAAQLVDSKRAVDVLDFVRMVEEVARLKRK